MDIIELNLPSEESVKEASITRTVLSELNSSYVSTFNHLFTTSILKHCSGSENIASKVTPSIKNKNKRDMQRKVCESINNTFAKNAAINFLSSNESFSGYQRKRLAQSFDQCEVSHPNKKRRINDSILEQYKDIVISKLSDWPQDKRINWSELGRLCGLNAKNRGQIVRDIAEESGIDTTQYAQQARSSIVRSSKAKLPGNEISVPAMPTVLSIKGDIKMLLDSGTITLGEPCSPFTVIRTSVIDGSLKNASSEVYGRKIPLLDLRQALLEKQEKFMHVMSNEEIYSLSLEEVEEKLRSYAEIHASTGIVDQYLLLKKLQRSRTLVLWHDHSMIVGSGYLLMTIHALYDPAVYLSTAEYERKSGRKCARSVQEIVEEPELYMLCMSSSSLSDQLSTISDRLDCFLDLSKPVNSSKNVPIHDSLMFFIGDHPAQSFERGNQVGGNYKCGSCGCKTSRIDDLANIFSCQWRSLTDLQKLVLAGKFGNQPGILKPFSNLKKDELQEELHARGVFDLSGKNLSLRQSYSQSCAVHREFLQY